MVWNPERRWIVEWRVLVRSPIDGRRRSVACRWARSAEGAKRTAEAAEAEGGEIRIRVDADARVLRRSAVYADGPLISRWDPRREDLPGRMRRSEWQQVEERARAAVKCGTALREAAVLACDMGLIGHDVACRIVKWMEQATEGRGPLVTGWNEAGHGHGG